MSTGSIFAQIIRGDLPARFVWKDEHVVAFLTKAPINPGHTLVVPRQEIDHWIDLEPALLEHLMRVSQEVARAIQAAFNPVKVGLMIAGLEVRHVHVHLTPANGLGDLNFERQDPDPDPTALDAAADQIRAALRERGHSQVVPD